MRYGKIPGLSKPVSRVVVGTHGLGRESDMANVMDDFFGLGGNAVDTAFVYGQGRTEQLLGHWLESSGTRQQAVLVTKGAHTPDCLPGKVESQLRTSLERLRTDSADVYMLHRDNPDVPVGEFVEALCGLRTSGLADVVGVSNWSLGRLAEANVWARDRGISEIPVLSDNLSLAQMVEPPWSGCISVSDDRSREHLAATQTVLLPWSSQAQGFFALGDDALAQPENGAVARCWGSAANMARRERARLVASRLGVSPTAVALSYVLEQPFPTFPIIGPRKAEEVVSSLEAMDIALGEAEIAWLEGRVVPEEESRLA